jgi:predicted RNA-binding Zn ribbon-like protein
VGPAHGTVTDTKARRPHEASRAFTYAVALRELMYRILRAAATDQPCDPSDVASLNHHLSEALGRLRIHHEGGAFSWTWNEDQPSLYRLLWPVLWSTAILFTSEDLNPSSLRVETAHVPPPRRRTQ